MSVKIETIPSQPMVFMRNTGPYGEANLQLMEKMKKWAKERDLLKDDAVFLGIAQDNPQVTAPSDCRYDVGIIVESDEYKLSEEVEKKIFEGGIYAVFKVAHTSEGIAKAWETVFSELAKKGIQPANKPIVERYSIEMVRNHFCELCVPIVQL